MCCESQLVICECTATMKDFPSMKFFSLSRFLYNVHIFQCRQQQLIYWHFIDIYCHHALHLYGHGDTHIWPMYRLYTVTIEHSFLGHIGHAEALTSHFNVQELRMFSVKIHLPKSVLNDVIMHTLLLQNASNVIRFGVTDGDTQNNGTISFFQASSMQIITQQNQAESNGSECDESHSHSKNFFQRKSQMKIRRGEN